MAGGGRWGLFGDRRMQKRDGWREIGRICKAVGMGREKIRQPWPEDWEDGGHI